MVGQLDERMSLDSVFRAATYVPGDTRSAVANVDKYVVSFTSLSLSRSLSLAAVAARVSELYV